MRSLKKRLFVSLPLILSLALVISVIQPKASSAKTTEIHKEIQQTAQDIEHVTGIQNIMKSNESTDTYSVIKNETGIIKIPKDSKKAIQLTNVSTSIHLPAEKVNAPGVATKNGTIVFDHPNSSVGFGVQPTKDGVRNLIKIKNKTAPKEYKYDLQLPEGSKLMTAAEYLGEEFDTGEVFVVDSNNIVTSVFSPAWAKDANKNDVPSHFRVEGNSLIQVIDFNENTAFPVIADPDWAKIGACSAAIAWFIGSNLFAAAKIIRVKKYIKELGGLKETAKLLAGATTWEEKLRVGGSAFKSLAAEITGVGGLAVCINW
ncbi:hypothetical protein P9D34_07535 [Bacillus swezeyi]|uniref:Uncharacterized protein n=1 Tax=Bacillus swezeyi TaxID=1925020 RepID=A0A1R1QL41_9BACI|nr:hypothetical protein [Bacillus swezeyi]MEC1260300.1 hypothetical protein [Bacillus swezeyi]MED2929907.1 hypothetical protein [Bacillus swezeyi]MED2942835.1 hypothetical protein [Bacillus swezeyi]MED2964679.1 hypothetical protein [Bacillus swezeyi]MED2976507.1 hypothetical protein [Bacillus swezeyi]